MVVNHSQLLIDLCTNPFKVVVADDSCKELVFSRFSLCLEGRASVHESLTTRLVDAPALREDGSRFFDDEIYELFGKLKLFEFVGNFVFHFGLLDVSPAAFWIGAVVVGDFFVEVPFGGKSSAVVRAVEKACKEPAVLTSAARFVVALVENALYAVESEFVNDGLVLGIFDVNFSPLQFAKIEAIAEHVEDAAWSYLPSASAAQTLCRHQVGEFEHVVISTCVSLEKFRDEGSLYRISGNDFATDTFYPDVGICGVDVPGRRIRREVARLSDGFQRCRDFVARDEALHLVERCHHRVHRSSAGTVVEDGLLDVLECNFLFANEFSKGEVIYHVAGYTVAVNRIQGVNAVFVYESDDFLNALPMHVFRGLALVLENA